MKIYSQLKNAVALLFLLLLSNAAAQEFEDLFKMPFEDLLNIEITTAAKKPEKVSEIPASIVVITRDDIEKYGYQSLQEILENVPGFYMIDDYFWMGGYNFGVRGFYSTGVFNDLIILVDGVNMKEDYYDSYNLAKINIPVEAIDRIEIVRGPMSVIYGSGAFLGAINIVTKHNTKNINVNDNIASVLIGSDKAQKIFLRLSRRNKDFSITANGNIYRNKRIGPKISDMAPYPFPEFWGISDKNARIRQRYKNQYFNIIAKYKDYSIIFNQSTSTQNVVDGAPALLDGDLSRINNASISLILDKKINDKLSVFSKISSFFYSQLNEYDMYSQYAPQIKNIFGYAEQNMRSWEGEANLFYNISKNTELTAGIFTHITHYLQTTINIPVVNYDNILYSLPSDENIITQSAWAQVETKLIPNFKTIAGLRIEKLNDYTLSITDFSDIENPRYSELTFTEDKMSFIPRLAFILTPSNSLSFKLMYGKAIKQPSYGQNNEVFKAYHFNNTPITLLSPARISTLEFNITANISNSINTNFSVFHNDLDNLITRENFYNENDKLAWRIGNSGKMETTGMEFSLCVHPIKNWKIETSFIVQKTRNKQTGFKNIEPGYAPKTLSYLKTNFTPFKNLSVALIGRYVGKMYSMWDITSGKRIGMPSDPSLVMDANIRISSNWIKRNFISCHIYNLLNTTIRYPATGNSKWAPLGTIGMGRTFFITFGIKW